MKFFKILIFPITLCLFYACDDTKQVSVFHIKIEKEVIEFDKAFYKSSNDSISSLKKQFGIFFQNGLHDTVWANKMKDKLEVELFQKAKKVFGNFTTEKQNIKKLFQHIKYYFTKTKIPQIYTYISKLDFDYPVLYADTVMFIAKDLYLGQNQNYYAHLPAYLSSYRDKKYLTVDIATAMIKKILPLNRQRTMISQMIYHGKILYLLELFLPTAPPQIKHKYTQEKYKWVEKYQHQIWVYFLQNKVLYSKSKKFQHRFLNEAPFSKFYLTIDSDSPGKIARYIGYKIIKSYMENNENISLEQMLKNENAQDVFINSKYKPN